MPFVNYAQLEEERVKFFSVFHIGLTVQDFSMTYFSKRPVLFSKQALLEQIYILNTATFVTATFVTATNKNGQ